MWSTIAPAVKKRPDTGLTLEFGSWFAIGTSCFKNVKQLEPDVLRCASGSFLVQEYIDG